MATFAVIFDFDGTILDSESAEYHSHRQFFAEHGVELTQEEWCTGIGRVQPERTWWEWLCTRTTTPPTYERFRKTTRTYFVHHLRMEPMPGIETLVAALVAARVPRAIASAASLNWVARALKELHIGTAFEVIVTGDQVEHTKPAPDVYLEAARRLGVEPEHCVAIEDSEPGLTAARAAGMHTVAIPHHLNRLTHDFDGADLELASAADLTLDRIRELAGVR